ncbi:MAG: cupin domain-containing protein [Ramlibacter sp.]
MAIHHAASGELIDIRPLGPALRDTVTRALYKSDHLELFRMVLPAGKTMPAHDVPGEITVQCLEGSVEFRVGSASTLMRPGDLLCLGGGVSHAVSAAEDSSILVTILLGVRA